MASNYWMKLWIEVLDDPKMGRLSEHLWKRFFELCLIAKELNKGGKLPQLSDISWRLRTTTEEIEQDLDQLSRYDLVEFRAEKVLDMHWFITNFAKRQNSMSSAERSRRHRESNPCNANATNRPTEKDTEEEKEEEARFPSFSANEIKTASRILSKVNQHIFDLVDDKHITSVLNMYVSYGEDEAISILQNSHNEWCSKKTEKGSRYNPDNPAWIIIAEENATNRKEAIVYPGGGIEM